MALKLAFLVMQIATALLQYIQQQGLLDAGRKIEVARQLKAMADAADAASVLREEISGMPDDEIDNILRE